MREVIQERNEVFLASFFLGSGEWEVIPYEST